MKINLEIPVVGKCVLTTQHAASSYNIPVLVRDDGQVFGPGDIVSVCTVAEWIRASSQWTGAADEPWSDEVRAALVRFGVEDKTYPNDDDHGISVAEFFQS